MFIEIEKDIVVNLHNYCKQKFDTHVPYATIKQEYKRAFAKFMKRNTLKYKSSDMISTDEIIATFYEETSKRLIKKYKFDEKMFFA